MRLHPVLFAAALLVASACDVEQPVADVPDLDSISFTTRSLETAEGTCWYCPEGQVGHFDTRQELLTEDQWIGIIGRLGPYWCAEYTCSTCGDVDVADCEFDRFDFVAVGDDGRTATAEMYCYCPLW